LKKYQSCYLSSFLDAGFYPKSSKGRAFGDLKRATKDKIQTIYYITNPRSQVSFLFGLEKDAFAFFCFSLFAFSRIERERERKQHSANRVESNSKSKSKRGVFSF